MLILTAHVMRRLAERGIPREWVEATLAAPDWTAPDPDPALRRAFKAIPAFGGRVLRVVFRTAGHDIVVITAMFDRGARR